MVQTFRILLFLAFGIFISGCEKDYLLKEPAVDLSLPVSFGTQIQPILSEDCATTTACHASGGNTPDLTSGISYNELQAYVDTANAEGSEVYLRISSTDPQFQMPPNTSDRLSDTEIGLILAWIKQGAQNN